MIRSFQGTELIPTRRSLLSRLKNWSDQSGWQEFFDIYWQLIYRVAVKAGLTDSEAQDVVQETLLELAKKMPGFHYNPAIGSFKGWLLHTTQWKILAQFKRRRRERREVHWPEDNGINLNRLEPCSNLISVDWDTLWEAEWERNLLQAALERVKIRVSPQQFEIFYLHVLKGQTVKAVATALEVNAGQVYLAKYRVGRVLRKEVLQLRQTLN